MSYDGDPHYKEGKEKKIVFVLRRGKIRDARQRVSRRFNKMPLPGGRETNAELGQKYLRSASGILLIADPNTKHKIAYG
jgi:hypothetical protein